MLQTIKSMFTGIVLVAVVIATGWGVLAFFSTRIGHIVGATLSIAVVAAVSLSFLFVIGDAFLDAVGWN